MGLMKKLLFFAAALLCLVACNSKDNALNGEQPIEPKGTVTITAKVEIGSGSQSPIRMVAPNLPISTTEGATINFHWEKGDQILLKNSTSSECQVFTIIDNSINGNTANFTGTALTEMSNYTVWYLGKNPSLEKLMAVINPATTDSITYEANNFHPYVRGEGNETSIELNVFMPVFQIPLKGNATVGKLDYYMNMMGQKNLQTTMSFGTGLVLTDTETPVYIPVIGVSSSGLTIKIYDTNDVCLLTKTVSSLDVYSTFFTFPALEVKAE